MSLIYQEKNCQTFFLFLEEEECLMCHSLVYRMMKPKTILNSWTSHACALDLYICSIMPIYFVDFWNLSSYSFSYYMLATKVFMNNNKRFSSFIPTFLLYTVTHL